MILAYDVNIPNDKKYGNYAWRQRDILAFHESGKKNCQIAIPAATATKQKARQAQSAYIAALKRLNLNTSIKCVIRGSCVYLVKIEKEGE